MAYHDIMKATLVARERIAFSDTEVVEMVVWRVPIPVPPTTHGFKYRLVYVENGERVLGYDNERGKGDHRHFRDQEYALEFETIDKLLSQFVDEVEYFRAKRSLPWIST